MSGSDVADPEPTDVDDAVHHVGKPVRRPGSRRVVMVSDVDAKRIKAGEFDSAEEALHASDRQSRPEAERDDGAASRKREPAGDKAVKRQLSARDRDILADVPPHFGNL